MKINLLLSILFIFLVGCAPAYKKEFILVVDEHNQVTQETTASVIKSVEAALTESLTDKERQDLVNLKARLEYMRNSSLAIRKYIYANQIDEELLQELLRNRWKSQ